MASLAEQREAAEQEAIALLREENALKRRRLDQERREIEALEQRNLANHRLVRLNVGGKHFDTFRETFDAEPGSYFDRFLGGQGTNELAPGVTDTDGRFVIDRDGELFGLLLRGLRGASLSDVSAAQRAELVEETIFYGMDRLMHRLLQGYDPYCLSQTDLELRLQAQAALRCLDGGGGGGENPELIDVLANLQSFTLAPEDERRLADPETPLLFENARDQPSATFRRGVQPRTAEEFRSQLDRFAGPLFAELDLTNLCVAGGGVLRTLYLMRAESNAASAEAIEREARAGPSDVDIFVLCGDDAAAKAAMHRVYRHLWSRLAARSQHARSMLVARSKFAITFVCGYPQRNVQLVLRRYDSVADVLYHFDVDCCQLAYYDGRVLATPSARRALTTGVNCADPTRASRTYESRLSKYAGAFGFAVAVPGLQMSRVAEQLRSGEFTFRRGSLHRIAQRHPPAGAPNPFPDRVPKGKVDLGEKLHGLPKLLVLSATAWRRFGLGPPNSIYTPNGRVEQVVFDEGDVVQESVHHTSLPENEERRCDLVRTVAATNGEIFWLDEEDDSPEEYDRGANAILLCRPGVPVDLLHNELVARLHRSEVRLPPMVWDCVEVVQGGEPPPLPNVTDAAQHNQRYFDEYLKTHLAQHVEFPGTGDSNPFARIADAGSWFGEVYGTPT